MPRRRLRIAGFSFSNIRRSTMKAYLKFTFYNSLSKNWEFLTNGVEVQVCRAINQEKNFRILSRTRRCDENGLFAFPDVPLNEKADIFFRVGFFKRNLDLRDGRLYGIEENHPIPGKFARYPVPLITWSSLKQKGIRGESGFFHGIRNQSLGSPQAPLTFSILFRHVLIFGHRGAPYHYPENSMDSLNKALEIGANALEMDLCLTADEQLVVLHDPDPFTTPTRQLVEKLPYPLVSPQIEFADGEYHWRYLKDRQVGTYSDWQSLTEREQLRVSNLPYREVRKYFSYKHPTRGFVSPPLFREVLQSLSSRKDQRLVLFLDLKSDDYAMENKPDYLARFSRQLHRLLKPLEGGNWHFILGCPEKKFIKFVASDFVRLGKIKNVDFVIDAEGGFKKALSLGLDRKQPSPLQENLKAGFRAVSIGKLARPGSRKEIQEAINYRQQHPDGQIQWVIYWTIDKRQEIYRALQQGVDGILTNRPEEALEVCRRLKVTVRR